MSKLGKYQLERETAALEARIDELNYLLQMRVIPVFTLDKRVAIVLTRQIRKVIRGRIAEIKAEMVKNNDDSD